MTQPKLCFQMGSLTTLLNKINKYKILAGTYVEHLDIHVGTREANDQTGHGTLIEFCNLHVCASS